MPWSAKNPPRAARKYTIRVARKAASVANALLRRGMSEGQATRIAAATARKWAKKKGIKIRKRGR